jgi:hypothetical protein
MESCDRFLQVVTADETHGVERPAVRVGAEPVHWHDARMLQRAGDLRFQQKTTAAVAVVGMTRLNLLERDFTVQLDILRDEHFAQATPSMRPQDAIAQRRSRRVIHRRGSPRRVRVIRVAAHGNNGQARLHVVVRDLFQFVAQRIDRADDGKALVRIVVMLGEMLLHQRVEQFMRVGVERLLSDQNFAEQLLLGKHPGMHRRDQLVAGNEIRLQGQNAKKKIAIGKRQLGHGGHSRSGK